MDDEVEVIINPRTGEVTIKGENPKSRALKKALRGVGVVKEEHIGAEHVHDGTHDHEHVHN